MASLKSATGPGPRILLISANRCVNPDPVFPLGLACVGAALRRSGFEVRWHDALVHTDPLERVLAEYRPILTGISLRNIDDVLLRKQEMYCDELGSICSTVKRAGCPVVLGGSGFSIFPAMLMRSSGADYGITGPGEAPMVELARAISEGKSPAGIPGLVRRVDGTFALNPAAPKTPGLALGEGDRPPDVAAWYIAQSGTLNVQTQRGCSFKCCYCTYPILEGRRHLRRAPEEIAEEFESASRLGAKYLFVVDSVFNSSPQHVGETCEAILRRDVKIPWGCFLRPQGLTSELMGLMARAGLAHVEFGTDSFCDEVLEECHKGLTFDEIRDSSQLARAAEVDCCHFLICGGPGETRETLRRSYERSRTLDRAVVMAVPGMRIYPGTPLHARSVAEGRLSADDNLLEPRFYISSAFTPETLCEELQGFSRLSPNWISGEATPAFARMVERLRRRGVIGPLWGYAAMVQRLWPSGFATA